MKSTVQLSVEYVDMTPIQYALWRKDLAALFAYVDSIDVDTVAHSSIEVKESKNSKQKQPVPVRQISNKSSSNKNPDVHKFTAFSGRGDECVKSSGPDETSGQVINVA